MFIYNELIQLRKEIYRLNISENFYKNPLNMDINQADLLELVWYLEILHIFYQNNQTELKFEEIEKYFWNIISFGCRNYKVDVMSIEQPIEFLALCNANK